MSVRDRLNQKAWEAEQKEKPVRPNINTGTQQVGTSTSVRGAQEAAAFATEGPEVLAPNMSNHRNGMTAVMGFNTSVRDRITLATAKAEETAKPAVASIADQYLAEHNAREAAEEAKRQADIKSGKLKILGRGEF